MADTLREDLEAAILAEESSSTPTPTPAPAPETVEAKAPATEASTEGAPAESSTEGAPTEGATEGAPATTAEGVPTEPPTETQIEPPPQSWKPALKAKWSSLEPELRQEIIRRERDILREFGVSSHARKLANDLQEVTRPYEGRMRALNVTPIQAVGELLKADYALSTAPPTQKAQFMAKLIKDYGVDIAELDSALAGQQADPTTSRVEQLLQQQLAPVQQFMQQQQQTLEAERQAREQAAIAEIQQMANDHVKYPYFETVRNDMADLIDLNARRGIQLSLADAYAKAVQINPETAPLVRTQTKQVQVQNNRAQKAIQASASVKGAPAGSPTTKGSDSLRDTIEAAFAQVEGR